MEVEQKTGQPLSLSVGLCIYATGEHIKLLSATSLQGSARSLVISGDFNFAHRFAGNSHQAAPDDSY